MNKKKADYSAGHAHQAVGHTMGGRGFVWPTFILSTADNDFFSYFWFVFKMNVKKL